MTDNLPTRARTARTPNPIACVASWIGGLFRGPTPAYRPAPPAPASVPAPTTQAPTARVRRIEVQRATALDPDGGRRDDDGAITVLTLVVDDPPTAATVLEALHTGALIRVTPARCA